MTAGECMKRSRERAGWTIKELAEHSGVAPQLIGQYERDLTIPKLTTVELLADALCISIDEYVGHEVNEMAEFALTHKQKEWAYRKWCEGYSQAQIAEALFVCEKTIQRALSGRPRIRPVLVYEEVE